MTDCARCDRNQPTDEEVTEAYRGGGYVDCKRINGNARRIAGGFASRLRRQW